MSILIRGMEMPESCPCKLVGVGYDLYCSFTSGIPSRMREYVECCEKETRPDWCPIGDVPAPHGRLIDADALLKDARKWVDAYWIDMAPTIIEAEEET